MVKYFFPNGVATQTGAYIIVQVMKENGEFFEGNLFVDYRFNNTEGFGTDWTVSSICFHERKNVIYAAGENGEVLKITDAENVAELISPIENGPTVQGPIREMQVIGNDLYAVGMGRQVYRRISEGNWEHIDTGMLNTSGCVTTGLTSITGDNHGFLVAVGYDGEIWEYRDTWKQIVTPTNLLLTRVISHQGKYYAVGLVGIVLCREQAGWRVIEESGFKEDIWDIEVFRGTLYLGTTRGLFWLSIDEEIKPVNPATFTKQICCSSLSARQERLWCFGSDIVSSTTDGVLWREEIIFSGSDVV